MTDRKSAVYYDKNGNPAPLMYDEAYQKITVGAASVASTAMAAGCVITVCSDYDAYLAIGFSDVVATTSDKFIPGSNIPIDICLGEDPDKVKGGRTHIAMIQREEGGTAHVTEYK